MKTRCIKQKATASYKFFLLMIAPLLIGAMITLMSVARADWNTQDSRLSTSPFQQGWDEVKEDDRITLL